ncbi:MAG: Glutamate-tRNA ligase [candidate division WS6 bacterium GW2011_GWF2_39_15]|uniref:Glutamate--tRNA ligase n=1 Tax=candidate division WS6 bacterium GW2011_GWF2_39_15 TaxID=1619100 RepID=A0A0G0MS22_9BACT|nr:MAG: Glutamate-tRNA ligase [candidate division WS6 bacterium GW2011_GWF2_39_15]
MNEFRYRAAPSPTGKVHIGTIRAYLPNYLLAKKYGGKNILRVEDTDQTRLVPNGVEAMIEAYENVGIEFDEGPHKPGKYGPYVQSERLDIYKKYADELVEKGHAYYCFCSKERLEKLREDQKANKLKPMYDGLCRDIPVEEAKKKVANGESHVIRMRFPNEGVTVSEDIVYGKVSVKNSDVEDQILMKADGFPTYHLAVVVDDHLMEITTAIRGDDWLPSYPKHVKLYEMFGWKPPKFAHLPMILNPDGRKKLSKRHGAFPVSQILRKGYLKEAIMNYALLCGWAPRPEMAHQDEIYMPDELIQLFDLDRVHRTAARYDQKKFDYINSKHIRRLSIEELVERVFVWAQKYVLGEFISDSYTEPAQWESSLKVIINRYLSKWKDNIDLFKKALLLEQDRIVTLSDIPYALDFFYEDEVSWEESDWNTKNHDKKELASALENILPKLEEIFKEDNFDHDEWEKVVRGHADELGWKHGDLFLAIRSATTGRLQSPPLLECYEIMGWEKVKVFILQAINWLRL